MTIKCILRQILSGLAHCHASKVMHRNLKPENILIDPIEDNLGSQNSNSESDFKVVISDFAYSR